MSGMGDDKKAIRILFKAAMSQKNINSKGLESLRDISLASRSILDSYFILYSIFSVGHFASSLINFTGLAKYDPENPDHLFSSVWQRDCAWIVHGCSYTWSDRPSVIIWLIFHNPVAQLRS